MKRLPDWEPRLAAFLAATNARAHQYGEHDCLLFGAGDVEAVTGEDFGSDHRGKYATAEEARAYLRTLGRTKPATLIASILPEKPVNRAQRGDIVLDNEGIPGVCIGGVALMVSEAGTVRVPRRDWVRAWAVGQ